MTKDTPIFSFKDDGTKYFGIIIGLASFEDDSSVDVLGFAFLPKDTNKITFRFRLLFPSKNKMVFKREVFTNEELDLIKFVKYVFSKEIKNIFIEMFDKLNAQVPLTSFDMKFIENNDLSYENLKRVLMTNKTLSTDIKFYKEKK